ncbi:MAG TPA: DUF4357 domain-containing protein [Pseudorhizobium sp.]|nr:DUF4357 domain-containing protein [Pseudorhizobium sp.]
MAEAILGGGDAARNYKTDLLTSSAPITASQLPGLVPHPLLTPDDQVRILSLIDETGSATLGDLMAALVSHERPATAVLELVAAGALSIEPGLIDSHSAIRRSVHPVEEAGTSAGGHNKPPRSERVRQLDFEPFEPQIFFGTGGARKDFGRHKELSKVGIYGAVWADDVYIGYSRNLGQRIARGEHLTHPTPPELIFAIVDRHDRLTEAEARVAERLLAMTVDQHGEKPCRNSMPAGDLVDPACFDRLVLFVNSAALALRQAGLFFTGASADALTQVPWGCAPEPTEIGTGIEADPGELFELNACGITARARVEDGRWVVLAGSQVRPEVRASASASASQRRIELLHNGTLARAGRHLVLRDDLAFRTASGAAHFVLGSKMRADIWTPITPDAAGAGLKV